MSYKIIPMPKKIKIQKGKFKIDKELHFYSTIKISYMPHEMKNILGSQTVLNFPDIKGYYAMILNKKTSQILLDKSVPEIKDEEHYFIRITSERISVYAISQIGLLRAFATLQSMIRQDRKYLDCCEIEDWPDIGIRGYMACLHNLHDFMPLLGPNPEGFRLILDRMFEAKLNYLLIEYEAMYPWRGKHSIISCKDAFNAKEVRMVTEEAKVRGIEIIPLVQTLGHVYHLLIHKEYKSCEESPEHPQQLCPLKGASFKLACELVDDTMRLHPESKYVHLGGDECRQLGICLECAEFVKKHGKQKLYAQFYKRLTDYVIGKGFIPIIWHDIAIKAPETLADFNDKVIFHFWNYGDISHGPMEPSLKLLRHTVGNKRILGGSAARGEAPHGAVMPSMRIVQNNVMEINTRMNKEKTLGSIMTDWPGSGIPFLISIFPLFMQGEFAWNAIDLNAERFRKIYTFSRFHENMPELLEMFDAIYGNTPFAKSFTTQLKHPLNRCVYAPYDFIENLEAFMESLAAKRNGAELYQLFHKRFINIEVVSRLEKVIKKDTSNRIELEAQLLAARTNLIFISLALGTAWAYRILKDSNAGHPDLAIKDLRYYIENEKFIRKEYIRVYGPYTTTRHLKNYLDMLLKPEVRNGILDMLQKLNLHSVAVDFS